MPDNLIENDAVFSANLNDLVDAEALQKIQDKLSKVTRFGAIITDNSGNPITNYSMFSPICQAIRNHPVGKERCQQCDSELGRYSQEEKGIRFHYCHAGLIDLAAPIIVNGENIGSILCGQVRCDTLDEAQAEERYRRCVRDLEMDEDEMMELYEKIPHVSYERIEAVAELLQVIADHVVELGVNRINQSVISEISMSIMEEQKTRLQLEQSLKLSELKSLESTVNPHFLFNALNMIARLAMLENAPQTEEIAYALAELLRYNLRRVGTCIQLKEELDYMHRFIQIQKARFADRFEYIEEVSDEALNAMIPAMTLQPLIENAFVHGMKNKSSEGKIRIKAKMDGDVLALQVSDNGQGIESERLAELRAILENKGVADQADMFIGLSNVCKQLHYFFDSNCAMDISSVPEEGTVVTITAYEPAMNEKRGVGYAEVDAG